MDKSVTGR